MLQIHKLCKYYQQAPTRHFRCMHHTYSATRSQKNEHFLQHPTWFPPPKPPVLIPPPSPKRDKVRPRLQRIDKFSLPPAESWGTIKQGKNNSYMQPAKFFISDSSRPVTFGRTKHNTAFMDVPISYWVKFNYGPWCVQKGLLSDLKESLFLFLFKKKKSMRIKKPFYKSKVLNQE